MIKTDNDLKILLEKIDHEGYLVYMRDLKCSCI